MKLLRQSSLLFLGGGRRLPRPRLSKMASCADILDTQHSSNSSTEVEVWSVPTKHGTTTNKVDTQFVPQGQPTRKRRVTFVPTCQNTTHDSPWTIDCDRDQRTTIEEIVAASYEYEYYDYDSYSQSTTKGTTLISQKANWYSRDDVAKFKEHVQSEGLWILNKEKYQTGGSCGSTTATCWSDDVQQAYNGLYATSSLEEMTDIVNTGRYLQWDPLKVGLDKWVLTDLRKLRNERRLTLVNAVIRLQDSCSPTKLRSLSRSMSKRSRFFAHYMALAAEESSSI